MHYTINAHTSHRDLTMTAPRPVRVRRMPTQEPAVRPLCLECLSRVCHHFDAPPPHLTSRQTEVLRLLAGGLSNKEIGGLMIPPVGGDTVKQYMHHALREIGISTRYEGAIWARDHVDALSTVPGH